MTKSSRRDPMRMVAWAVDNLRPFCPGLKTMVILLLALQSVAVALMINTTVAFSVVTVLAMGVIKIYKVHTEPLVLLLLHTVISCSMLSDHTTTLAVIVASIAVAITIGDYELSGERVTVFLASMLSSFVFNKPMAIISCLLLGAAITSFKLRPLRPATVSLLALSFQAWAILTSSVFGTITTIFYMTVVIMLYILDRVADSEAYLNATSSALVHSSCNGSLTTTSPGSIISTNNNHHSQPVPGGYLQLSNATESLDLHGHTVTGAMAVLHKFLRESEDTYRNNRVEHIRHVTIITGEGEHDDERSNGPLLKPTVLNFLKINKYKYEVSRDPPGLIKVDLESHVF